MSDHDERRIWCEAAVWLLVHRGMPADLIPRAMREAGGAYDEYRLWRLGNVEGDLAGFFRESYRQRMVKEFPTLAWAKEATP